MILTKAQEDDMIEELKYALNAHFDGSRKNLIAAECPYCGKTNGKFGVYVGKEEGRKRKFASNCFSCGCGSRDLVPLLIQIGRPDLIPVETAKLDSDVEVKKLFSEEDVFSDVDDELIIIDLPDGYERVYEADYLEERGFEERDYEYFQVGKSDNFKFREYVIFPIIDDGDIVGYVSRHEWSKKRITRYNRNAKKNDKYQILRYRNSSNDDNDFIKLLYNYDNVIEDETETVILMEGIFDVINITQTLNLYDNHRVAAVCTFGKKVSDVQMYKLQKKGVQNIILGYDSDVTDTIKKVADKLDKFFDCMIADIPDVEKDFGDLDFWEMFDVFSDHLKTPIEYKLNRVSQNKLKI